MKFNLKSTLKSNATLKALSIIIGYGVWNMISAHQTYTASLQIPVCFYHESATQMIDAPERIMIQLQGKKNVLRGINRKTLALHIDASQLHHGPNPLLVDQAILFLPDTVKVVHYSPTNIVINVKEKNQA
jgi:hypothetical protein